MHVRDSFCFQSPNDFEKFTIDQTLCVCAWCVCACMCVCVHTLCVCVCLSVASHISETRQAIAITLVTLVTASVMRMRHVLIILTLTFIKGHTDLSHENNKCSIILKTVQLQLQAMPITFAVNIVWLTVYIIFSHSDDLALHSRSQLRLKLDKLMINLSIAISRTGHDVWNMHGIFAHGRFDDLDARS